LVHEASCPQRRSECRYCGRVALHIEQLEHEETCEKRRVCCCLRRSR
jgi:hypothetical protein